MSCNRQAVKTAALSLLLSLTAGRILGQTQTGPSVTGGATGAAQNPSFSAGSSLTISQNLPSALAASMYVMGARMQNPDRAQVTLVGTVTDSEGSRNARIMVQAPGYWAYREADGRAVTFDGTNFKTKSGQFTGSDDAVGESLLAHLPDSVFLQLALGGSLRRIGSHFRVDSGENGTHPGTYCTIFAFSPKPRLGLAAGKALQQPIFIAVDEHTGLISNVRVVVKASHAPATVTETYFNNWFKQEGQWFPGKIVRLENGRQTLSFQTEQASTGRALAVTEFQP